MCTKVTAYGNVRKEFHMKEERIGIGNKERIGMLAEGQTSILGMGLSDNSVGKLGRTGAEWRQDISEVSG